MRLPFRHFECHCCHLQSSVVLTVVDNSVEYVPTTTTRSRSQGPQLHLGEPSQCLLLRQASITVYKTKNKAIIKESH
jgi:hypothetical protein